MKRNSTQVEIVTPGATIWLPWIETIGANRFDGCPDFSELSEPSLSVRVNAWEEFLNSGQEFEFVADPDPVLDPPVSNWTPLNFELFDDPHFVNYGFVVDAINPFLISALVESYGMAISDGISTSKFHAYWQEFCQIGQVSIEHRNQWADMAEDLGLPQEFVNVIRYQ